jgi:hypothetical protein
LKGIQDQQILIAGDNHGTLAGARRRQNNVVISVATSRRFKWDGRYDRERFLEQPDGRSHIRSALTKFSSQDVAKLVQERSRRNHHVVPDAVLEKIAADAARHESGDQHVRVQQELHETRVNTSSSVKMP